MNVRIPAARLFLLTLLAGPLTSPLAQTGPNAPTEPPASGAIIIPPDTGDGEAIQKKTPPPIAVDPGIVTPPPISKELKPDPKGVPTTPVPPRSGKKDST